MGRATLEALLAGAPAAGYAVLLDTAELGAGRRDRAPDPAVAAAAAAALRRAGWLVAVAAAGASPAAVWDQLTRTDRAAGRASIDLPRAGLGGRSVAPRPAPAPARPQRPPALGHRDRRPGWPCCWPACPCRSVVQRHGWAGCAVAAVRSWWPTGLLLHRRAVPLVAAGQCLAVLVLLTAWFTDAGVLGVLPGPAALGQLGELLDGAGRQIEHRDRAGGRATRRSWSWSPRRSGCSPWRCTWPR